MPVIQIDIGPVARTNGVVYVHDVDLDDGVELTHGTEVNLRDEGGFVHLAVVEDVEPVRFGMRYRLTLR